MPGLAELAAVMMQGAERRIDVTAANISNVATPGYRGQRVFSQVMDSRSGLPQTLQAFVPVGQAGALKATGNALDLATDANAVLLLRAGEQFVQTRSVQLKRDVDGRLIDRQGGVLQAAGGGDVVVGGGEPQILHDGTVLINGQAEARIGMFVAADDRLVPPQGRSASLGSLAQPSETGVLRQGMVVPANVDAGTEMIELNKASRMAETGAKVFQLYDDLIGKAASQLGNMGK